MITGARRQGRELALKIIYAFPDQPKNIEQILSEFWHHFRFRDDVLGDAVDDPHLTASPGARDFAEELSRGVFNNLGEIDRVLDELSTNWTLERMARVDLALLRLGAYELIKTKEVPINVVINEAIEIGKRYGTRDTPGFVNGILDKISRIYR